MIFSTFIVSNEFSQKINLTLIKGVKIGIILAFLIHLPICKTSYEKERRELKTVGDNYTNSTLRERFKS